MAKKGVKVEDLIEVIQERILDVLEQYLLLNLSSTIERLFDRLVERAVEKLESLVEKATKHCVLQLSQISQIKEENVLLQSRLEDLELNMRSDSLVVRGLAEDKEETVPVGVTVYLLGESSHCS